MSTLGRVVSSSVGTKVVIAATGLALFLYLILHLVGNALIFAGADTFNGYSHALISNPLIVPVELGLLAVFVIHIYKTLTNYRANAAPAPIGYSLKRPAVRTSHKSMASSTMIVSGLVVLLFVLVHVKQFKYGAWHETAGPNAIRDLYRTEVEVFRQPLWVAFYVVCTLAAALHLRHGIASGFQSLGIDHPVYTPRLT